MRRFTSFRASLESSAFLDTKSNPEALDQDIAEIADASEEHLDSVDEMEEAGDLITTLESLNVILEHARSNGGLDRTGAAIVNLCVESHLKRFGLESRHVGMPSMECFGGIRSRSEGTRLAIEGLRETMKNMWEAIKKAIRKAADWIVEFFEKIFGAASGLMTRAKSLKEKAQSLKGSTKEKELESSGLAKALYTASTKKVENTVEGSKKLRDQVDMLMSDYVSRRSNIIGKDVEDLGEYFDKDVTFEPLVTPMVGASSVTNDDMSKNNWGQVFDGITYTRSAEFLGNKVLVSGALTASVTINKLTAAAMSTEKPATQNTGDQRESAESYSYSLEARRKNKNNGNSRFSTEQSNQNPANSDPAVNPNSDPAVNPNPAVQDSTGVDAAVSKTQTDNLDKVCRQRTVLSNYSKDTFAKDRVPVLSGSDMVVICDNVYGMAELISEFKKGPEQNRKLKNKLLANVEAFEKRQGGDGESAASKAAFNAVKRHSQWLMDIIDKPLVPFNAYALKTGKALLDQVDQSISKYE